MIFAGVDIGSLTSKAVILDDHDIRSWSIIPTGENNAEAARKVMKQAAEKAGLSADSAEYTVATGLGRTGVSFADKQATEIQCAAKGALRLFPSARIVIDIGAENCRVIRCDEQGGVLDFELNDKCAAGTGIFLETVAEMLAIGCEEMGELSLKSTGGLSISSTCAVFAESEVISLIHKGVSRADILAAVHRSIAFRVHRMLTRIGLADGVVMTGGVAKNRGFNAELSRLLGSEVLIPKEPQIVGSLGAALIAGEKSVRRSGD